MRDWPRRVLEEVSYHYSVHASGLIATKKASAHMTEKQFKRAQSVSLYVRGCDQIMPTTSEQ